jgi:hypothetical protein
MTNLRQPVYKTLLEIKEYYREYQRAAQQAHCLEAASVGRNRSKLYFSDLFEAAGGDRNAAVEKISWFWFRLRHSKHNHNRI